MANENTRRKIVVTTPTGHVGSRVVRLLLQAGIRPTLLLRDPTKIDAAIRDRVDVVQGDQGDADLVVRATRNADGLFWVDPPATTDGDPVAHYAEMGANAARAVMENTVTRTVFLSSVGAEKRHGAGEIDGLARTEELLNDTAANVLHLRCGYFFTNLFMSLPELRAGVLSTPWPVDHPMAWVDPRDIGEIVVARLLSDWSGTHVQAVHGPEDLTFSGVAEILSQVMGLRIRAERISDDAFRGSLRSAGLSDEQVEGIVGMSVGLRENFVAADERSVVTTTPTTLAAWAYAHLRPAR
ncbi:NmrA family NAD(P)-binding protein [Nocardia australiensis]|uniref:NmrA family NAD(P)-binding protein n=1 Tax=Nocardia australiensis TaxID=2887191 RepID=UPI001D137D1B|nr:NAD(P)H-binding protein [Nocardia australiensis]